MDLLTAAITSPDHPAAFATYAPGADLDVAADLAVTTAGEEHGFTGTHPSLAGADLDQLADPAPLTTLGAATLAVAADLRAGNLTPGIVHPYPIAANSAFTRRRVRVTLTRPLPVGPVAHLDPTLRAEVTAALEAAEAPLGPDELIEAVDVVRSKARYKPTVTVNRGPTLARFALLDPVTNTVIATDFPTAALARREAVARVKDGQIPGGTHLDVVKISTRDTGPFVRVERTQVSAATVVKVTVITAKNPDRTRITGWILAGSAPT